jgi:hypothetical protein
LTIGLLEIGFPTPPSHELLREVALKPISMSTSFQYLTTTNCTYYVTNVTQFENFAHVSSLPTLEGYQHY